MDFPRRVCFWFLTAAGGVLQERDVPAELFLDEMEKRGIKIDYAME